MAGNDKEKKMLLEITFRVVPGLIRRRVFTREDFDDTLVLAASEGVLKLVVNESQVAFYEAKGLPWSLIKGFDGQLYKLRLSKDRGEQDLRRQVFQAIKEYRDKAVATDKVASKLVRMAMAKRLELLRRKATERRKKLEEEIEKVRKKYGLSPAPSLRPSLKKQLQVRAK